jgi:hypothetical protein
VPTARHVATLAPETCAYLAGPIDGEGTMTLTREHRWLVVSVANTELAPLRLVRQAIGGGRVTRKRVASRTHAPSFAHRVTNRQAVALLRQILPHPQFGDARRAQLAVEHYVASPDRTRTPNVSGGQDFLHLAVKNLSIRRAINELVNRHDICFSAASRTISLAYCGNSRCSTIARCYTSTS